MRAKLGGAVGVGMTLLLAGCPPQRLVPDQVAIGVARLTMRTAGNVVGMVEKNDLCGFASTRVGAPVIDGEIGGPGSATWTVEDCEISLLEPAVLSKDCHDVETKASGRVLVNGTKTVRGIVTGNPENPVVPVTPDAATFELSAAYSGFLVTSSDSQASMKVLKGKMSFVVEPRLAVSAALGVCSVASGDVALKNVRWENGQAEVDNNGQVFTVDVPTSKLDAQVGKGSGGENALAGTITVWTTKMDIPTFLDKAGLDPAYNATKHVESYACSEEMLQPVTFECPSLKPRLAEGTARLSVAMFGNLASLVDKDATCGFSSPSVLSGASLTGAVGAGSGEATFTISQPCTINIPSGQVVSQDCAGVQTLLQGRVTVTGTKKVRGMRTGDPAEPIVPLTRDAADITLEAHVDGFRISTSKDHNALTGRSGTLAGTIHPRLARDTVLGACAIATPVVSFENIRWADADVLLSAEGNSFALHVDSATLNAQAGKKDGVENHLEGTISVDGEEASVPLDAAHPILDPTYDAAAHVASFACLPHMTIPASDADCALTPSLMDGSARLAIAALGAVTGITEENTSCGFRSDAVKNNVVIVGNQGQRGGTATWTITTPCTISFPTQTEASKDCNNASSLVQGSFTVTGTKTLRGILTGDPEEPVVPTSINPVEIHLSITFNEFTSLGTENMSGLRIHSGTMTGGVFPSLFMDQSSGACSIPTPVAEFQNVELHNAQVTVLKGPKSFNLDINAAQLNAQNGTKGNRTNFLDGSMNAAGLSLSVPQERDKLVLNPDFDAGHFAASWACKPHIKAPQSEAECSFFQALGENAARLAIQTIGVVGTMVNESQQCGFEDPSLLAFPDEVIGDVGQTGSMTWHTASCILGNNPAALFQEDCLGGEMWVGGSTTTAATRTVTGIREKLYGLVNSIRPDSRDDVMIRVDRADMDEFHTDYFEPDTGKPVGVLTVHDGWLGGTMRPILGERLSDRGLFDVSVPVVVGISRLNGVGLHQANVTLTSGQKRFNYFVDDMNIEAFNGSYHGDTNWLSGYAVVDGNRVEFNRIPLKPVYNQQSFDNGYACTRDLVGVISPTE